MLQVMLAEPHLPAVARRPKMRLRMVPLVEEVADDPSATEPESERGPHEQAEQPGEAQPAASTPAHASVMIGSKCHDACT